jgi:hypothetical protein
LASAVTESGIASPELATACTELAAQSRSLADVGAFPAPSELAAAVADARERVTTLVAVVADDDPQVGPSSIAIGRLADALSLVAAP